MSKAADTSATQPERRFPGRRVFVPLALVTAIGGFVTGMLGGPFLAPTQSARGVEIVRIDAGRFPIPTTGSGMQLVDASVSVRTDATAPGSPSHLHDALFALLTEAAAMPLVLDGRDRLSDLEQVVMAMAPVSAPWLVALDLEPAAALSTAALSANEQDPAVTGS